MKKRYGFVSNSSSSSFIMGIGVIKDLVKFNRWINKYNLTNVNQSTISDIRESQDWDRPMIDGDRITIESFNDMVINLSIHEAEVASFASHTKDVQAKKLLSETADPIICWFNSSGNHDDSDFWNGDEYDYNNISLDEFDEKDIRAYDSFYENNNGIIMTDISYGAGRDG